MKNSVVVLSENSLNPKALLCFLICRYCGNKYEALILACLISERLISEQYFDNVRHNSKARPGHESDELHWAIRYSVCMILFTNPSARSGYDTRSIFKRSLTGLNSEFSFS